MPALLITLCLVFTLDGFANRIPIPQGLVQGHEGDGHVSYKNVPYALPPVGPLRWRAPRPPFKTPNQIINTKTKDIQCPQIGNYFSGGGRAELDKPIGTEDCLYLQIWAPTRTTSKKLPVFFWIHGGSNKWGYSSDELYDGAELAHSLNAIVVNINYRLGLFGTMYTKLFKNRDQADRSGNFLTLDLLQGLNWVNENIKYFGGDNKNITIAGQSAGCINVWGIALSPLSQGKFKRMYCSSGIPNSYPEFVAQKRANSFIEGALVTSQRAANVEKARLLLEQMTDEEQVEFLYSLTTEQILSATPGGIPVQHVSDGYVFSQFGLFGSFLGRLNTLDMFIGTTGDDGSYFINSMYSEIAKDKLWDIVNLNSSSDPIKQLIRSENFLVLEGKAQSLTNLVNELVDYVLSANQSPLARIYRYRFNWAPHANPWQTYYKATHGVDLPFLFKKTHFEKEHFFKFLEQDLHSEASMALCRYFQQYLKGFVHKGDPNYYTSNNLPYWSSWTPVFLLPTNMIFSNSKIQSQYIYSDPLIAVDALNISDTLYQILSSSEK